MTKYYKKLEKEQLINEISNNIIKTLRTIPVNNNSVIVYDIDNTLINRNGIPIYPILKTYNEAKRLGFNIAIITSRFGTKYTIEDTLKELEKHGITDLLGVYFFPRTKNDDIVSNYRFKMKSRENIHRMGYDIVMSIGDQPWDIGRYGGIGYIVPS